MAFSFLEKKIKEQAEKYYTSGTQDVSDSEFDSMVDELKKTNPNSPVLTTGWGYTPNDVKGKVKRNHIYGTVGSLDKIHNWGELSSSLKEGEVVTSLKLDGLSVVLYYKNSYLDFALTRGDGNIGIDITDKMKRVLGNFVNITSIPDFTGGIRGEILMSRENFDRYLESHPEGKNPRNAVAGIIGANELVPELDLVDVLVYKVVGSNYNMFSTYEEMLQFLEDNFEDYVAPWDTDNFIYDEFFSTRMNGYRNRWYGSYPADGLVICDNVLDLTVDNRNNTTYYFNSQAFKFPAEEKTTEVQDVIWELSKHGVMVPKIRVTPVELSGTTVEYCAAFNAEYVEKNKLGLGAVVSMCKSGEIIPDIQSVIQPSEFCVLPRVCPVCHKDLDWEGVNLVCNNQGCSHKTRTDLLIWMSTLAPRDGLGDKIRSKFVDEVLMPNLTVEYLMTNKGRVLGLLSSYPYRGKQFLMFEYAIKSIYVDNIHLAQALIALNIPRLSDKTAQKLASYGKEYIRKLLENVCNRVDESDWLPELSQKIGDANSRSISEYRHKFSRLRFVWDQIENKQIENKDIIHVAITGKLSCKRADFENELKAHGFSAGSITKDTKYLITDDPNSSSEKNKKADKLGIVKISESDFRNQFMR